ncbi:hypothetical protein IKU74_01440 [bacterium]|nr:hypothetical protein [bacterium]
MANIYGVLGSQNRIQQSEVVNWGSCTAEEILEFEEQGQEVPEQYLSWAEEMAASMNVQDDVTYEMAQMESGGSGNAAADFRQQLSEDGVSLKRQGQIFTEESRNKEELTLQTIQQMGPLLNVPEQLEEEATQIADSTRTQLEVLKSQIESSAAAKDDKPRMFQGRAERGEIQGLEAVAKALGTQATNEMEGITQELEEVDKIINEGVASSQLSVDYGAETVAIGAELVGKGSSTGEIIGKVAGAVGGVALGVGAILGGFFGGLIGGLFGGSNRRVGKEAIEQGSQTMTVGQQGNQVAEQAADIHGVSIKSVEKSEQDLKTAEDSNATGGETDTPANISQPEDTASEEQAEDIVSQDPSVIITDPNEILKRKERRGLA